MEIRLIHLCPDLMNLYGSYANVRVLSRYLETCGCTVTVETAAAGEALSLAGADFLFLGAGTEDAAVYAAGALSPLFPQLRSAAEDGMAMLFAGTAMDLLGGSLTDETGKTVAGAEIGAFNTTYTTRRITGDVYGHTDLFAPAVVGFMNKCSRTEGVDVPFLTALDMGAGNTGPGTPEGFRRGSLIASQLTGPILVKNPALLQWMAGAILARRGAEAALPPVPEAAQKGWAVTEEQLRLRWQERK